MTLPLKADLHMPEGVNASASLRVKRTGTDKYVELFIVNDFQRVTDFGPSNVAADTINLVSIAAQRYAGAS